MQGHTEKTRQQTMEAKLKYRMSRKPNGEAQITCRTCRREFHVPSATTTYRCPACKTTNAVPANGQSNKDDGNGMGLVKLSAKNFRSVDLSQNANKSGYGLNQRPSSFSLIASSSFSSRRSNKRAVLCGVTYRQRRFKLKGTINDVVNMRELLVKVFDFPIESVRVLKDEQTQDLVPTKKNILEQLKWLVEGCQPGDSLVFYFSGHCVQQTDSNDDEIDAMDESILPIDFLQEGAIPDNELNSILVWPLKDNVTLHVIVDACHSGTVLDLSYVYDPEKCRWKDNKPPAKEPSRKHPSGGQAICISACDDHQLAADTSAFRGKGMNGVMTYLFTKIIKKYPNITYGGLLEQMKNEIEEMIRNSCRPSFLQHIFHRKIAQDLVISSSKEFDVSGTIFTL